MILEEINEGRQDGERTPSYTVKAIAGIENLQELRSCWTWAKNRASNRRANATGIIQARFQPQLYVKLLTSAPHLGVHLP